MEGQKIGVVATIDYEGENNQEFQLCVSVTHKGNEMNEDEIQKLFDLNTNFSMIENQNSPINSLAICKQICMSLGGDIKAVSEP